jgi:LCP family protein required for cell wall assembly
LRGKVEARVKQQDHPTIEFRGLRERQRSPLRRFVKVLVILGVIFGLIAGGYAIFVKVYLAGALDAAKDDSIRAIDPLPPGQSYNILVLGSDARDVLDRSQRNEREFSGSGGGHLADTILLIHVPADQKSATILSFPRDLKVRIPGKSGFHKVNSAYSGDKKHGVGGPDLMMNTIRGLTGLKIHHYIEVNFSSFQKIVDALGGVRLCPKEAYKDKQSGLILKKAGCQEFNGRLALGYVRMRKSDPRGDFGRIERQQEFIRVLMQKVKSIGFLTDPPRLFKTVDAIKKGVKTDYIGLKEGELRGIANKLAGFKQSNVDFRVVPSHSAFQNGVSYVIEETAKARKLYEALKNDTALPPYGKTGASIPDPEDVTMIVLNGTKINGLAGVVRDQLREVGYKVRSTSNAERRDYTTTVILYEPGGEAKALLLQEEFPGAKVQEATDAQDVDIVVILGTDQGSRASPSPSP